MTTIKANVSRMFSAIEPRYVSGSQAELGQAAGSITWRNALTIAAALIEREECGAVEAEYVRDWARETGAWDRNEIASWSDTEALGLFVQNVAGELRLLCADDVDDLSECAATYESTDWEQESEYPLGQYRVSADGSLVVEYYTGV
jgi:hypothetical protein